MERTGEILTTICTLIFDDFNLHNWSNWTWWLIAAFVLMVMYELWWMRYFLNEQRLSDFYSSFLGIPLAGATTCCVDNSYGSSSIYNFEILENYRGKKWGTEFLLLLLKDLLEAGNSK